MICLLPEPRHAPGLFFYSVYISAGGKKQESHWAWQPQRLSYLECGLTGLLNPTSICTRLFQQYFIKCFRRASSTGIGRTSRCTEAGGKCRLRVVPPVGSVKDCREMVE